MGKAGKVVAGVGLIVTGAVIGVFTGQWQLAFSVASLGAGLLMQPKLPQDLNDRTAGILENRVGTQQSLPVVYGKAKIAGVLADIRVHAGSLERKRLVMVPAFCHGSRDGSGITAIDEVWLDDRLAVNNFAVTQVPFSANAPGAAGGLGIKNFAYEHHLGSSSQTVDTTLNGYFPTEWPSAAQGRGICYSRIDLWYNEDVYPSGIPTIQVLVRGNKVYDPRDSTWKYSTNPALCIRDFLLSTIYGLGVPSANIEEQSFIDMANYCEELILLPDATYQMRYELNGWVDTSRTVEQNLAELCTSCRGQVVNEGDTWRLVIRRPRTVSGFKINETNTVEGAWQFILPGADRSPNVARASYIDPARNFSVETVQYPEPGYFNQYLENDNDLEQRLDMDLPFTQNRLAAQQLAMTTLRESREAIGVVCTLTENALRTRVGELVEVTNTTAGWTDKVFDVAALQIQPDGNIRTVLVEYEATVYDLSTQYTQPEAQDTNLPNPFELDAPTSLVLVSANQSLQTNDGRYIPRIRATWTTVDDPFVDYYEIQAKKDTDSSWDSFGRITGLEDPLFYVYPVTDEIWNVRIRAVNKLGIKSDWLEDSHDVVTEDPRPQILSITLTQGHSDSAHADEHSDVAHIDGAHSDAHTDDAHGDFHTDSHVDSHSDTTAHSDSHQDVHGDGDLHGDGHSDHSDHSDTHFDASASDHTDTGHVDSHSDAAHGDTPHSDNHVDGHGDDQFGVAVALQADTDSASVRTVARKHGDHSDGSHTDVTDPTEAEVRAQLAVNGRNVVVELIDVATGVQISLDPGDRVRVGALAYAETGGGGVEGPLALGSVGLFPVAPVGADKWVPT